MILTLGARVRHRDGSGDAVVIKLFRQSKRVRLRQLGGVAREPGESRADVTEYVFLLEVWNYKTMLYEKAEL